MVGWLQTALVLLAGHTLVGAPEVRAGQLHGGDGKFPGGESWLGRRLLQDEEYVEERVVDRIPVFTTPQLRKLVNEGDKLRLPCFVDRLEGFVLLWKRGETILSVGERVISFQDTRASIVSEREGNWLEVEGVRPEDGGEYTCHISATHPQEISHSVRVRTRPIIQSTNAESTVEEGKNATLSCFIKSGEPTPEITWTKDGRPTDRPIFSGPDLELVNLTWSTAGLYRCQADNGFTATSTDIIRLRVVHPPHIDQSDRFVHSSPSLPALLSCTVHAFPPPAVTWYRGESKLSSLQYNMSSSGEIYSLLLGPGESREGNYSCTATNTVGTQSKLIQLSNQVGPILFTSEPVQNSTDSYVLQWYGTSSLEVTKYILITSTEQGREVLELEIQPGTNSEVSWPGEYRLTGLKEATVYLARVAGVNSHGQGQFSEPFRFGTQGARLSPDPVSTCSKPVAILLLILISLSLFV